MDKAIPKMKRDDTLWKAILEDVFDDFLRYYVHLEDPLVNSKFEKEIDSIIQNNKTMGIEEFLLDRAKKEGIKEGLKEGLEKAKEKDVTFTKTLLRETSFSTAEIARLVGVSVEFVEDVKKADS